MSKIYKPPYAGRSSGGASSIIGVADYAAQAAKTSGLKVYLSSPIISGVAEISEWDLKGVLRHSGIQAHKDIWTNAAQTKGIRLTFVAGSGIAYDHDRGNNWRVYRGVANGNLVLTQNDGNAIFLLDGEILTGYTAAQLKTVIDNNAILSTAYFGGEDGTTELFENLTTTQIFGNLAQGGANFMGGEGPQSVGAQVSALNKTVTVRSKLTDNFGTIKAALDATDGLVTGYFGGATAATLAARPLPWSEDFSALFGVSLVGDALAGIGASGWTPVFRVVVNNARYLLRITDWVGGGGNEPASGYLAESGVVADPNDAIDFRGARGVPGIGIAGASGWTPVVAVEEDGVRRVLRVTDWTGGAGVKPAVGYLGAAGVVAAVADAIDIRGSAGAAGRPGFGFRADLLVDGIDEINHISRAANHLTIHLNEAGNAYLLTLLVGTVIWAGDGRYTVNGAPTMDGESVRVPVAVGNHFTALSEDQITVLISQSPFSVPVSTEILKSAALGEPTAAKFNQVRNFLGKTYACRRFTHVATTQAATWTAWTLLQDISAWWAAESGLRFRGINFRSSSVANAHSGDVNVTPGGTWTVYRIVGGIGWFHLDPPDYFLGPLVDEADATNHAVRNNNTALYDHRVWYSSAFVAGADELFTYYWLNTDPVYDVKGKHLGTAKMFPQTYASGIDISLTFELGDDVAGVIHINYLEGEAAVGEDSDVLYIQSLRPPGVLGILIESWATIQLPGQLSAVFQQIDNAFIPWGPGASFHSTNEMEGGAAFLKIGDTEDISFRLRNWNGGLAMRLEGFGLETISASSSPNDLEVRVYYGGLFRA